MTDTTVLVTGATGFVGRRLVPELVERGFVVRAMTRHPDDYAGEGDPVGVGAVTGDRVAHAVPDAPDGPGAERGHAEGHDAQRDPGDVDTGAVGQQPAERPHAKSVARGSVCACIGQEPAHDSERQADQEGGGGRGRPTQGRDQQERGAVPGHWHFDVRYVVRAGADERFVVSEESHDLAWREITAVADDPASDESMRRMAGKWLGRSQG